MRRLALYAMAFTIVSAWGVPASGQTPSSSNIVAKPIPINSSLTGAFTESTIAAKFDLNGSQFQSAIQAALGAGNPCLASREALILHFATWTVDAAAGPQLASSNYYVYHATSDAKGCHFQQAPPRASNSEPLLYGDQSARFVGISVFAAAPPQAVTISYRVYSTPATAQNVTDLGALVQALLGLTAAAGGGADAVVAQPTVYVAAGSIAGYSKSGHVRLPFDFNISYGLSVPSAAGGGSDLPKLPSASLNTAYSCQVPIPGGFKNPQYTLTGGTPPAGLSLSPNGFLTGTPSASGPAVNLSVQITDGGAKPVHTGYSLAVGPAIGSSLPGATVGTPYNCQIPAPAGYASPQYGLSAGSALANWFGRHQHRRTPHRFQEIHTVCYGGGQSAWWSGFARQHGAATATAREHHDALQREHVAGGLHVSQ